MNRRDLFRAALGLLAAAPLSQLQAVIPVRPWTYRRTCWGCGRDIDAKGYCPSTCPVHQANMQALLRALEAGGYNAAPSQLVQGCGLQVEDLSPVMAAVTFEPERVKFYRGVTRKTL